MKHLLIIFYLFLFLNFIIKAQPSGLNITVSQDTICKGQSVQLNASGGLYYSWSPSTGLNRTDTSNIIATPTKTTTYYVNAKGGKNLIVNGDFESGNTGFITDYAYCNSSACLIPIVDSGYAVGSNANLYNMYFSGHDHTTGNGNFMIVNGGVPSLVVWEEIITVHPNTNYLFSAGYVH